MDVTCGDCGAHFRLDVALLKGEKGARIRCRKCGGHIVVRLPEESPVPVLPPQEINPPSTVEPAAPAQEWMSPWPVEAPAPIPLPQPEAVPPEMSGPIFTHLEDMFVPSGEDAGPDRIPPPPEEYTAGEIPAEETPATEPESKAPSRRAPSRISVLIIPVLWILLLAGGAFYFGTTKSGQDMLGKLFAGWGSGRTGSAPARPVYDIRDVKWHVEKGSAAGNLFVIKGSVANVGNAPSAGIRIQATLLGKDNEALAEKAAFAGNLIDETSIGKMDRVGIEGVLSTRLGEGNVNREIPKDKALPFMVVFFDPPGGIEAVKVTAIDAR